MPFPSWVSAGSVHFDFTGGTQTWTLPDELAGYVMAVFIRGAGGSGDGERRYVATGDPDDPGSYATLLPAGDPRYGSTVTVDVGGDASGTTGGWPDGGAGGSGANGATDGAGGGGSTSIEGLRTDPIVLAGTGGPSGTPGYIATVNRIGVGEGDPDPETSNARQVPGGQTDDGGNHSVTPDDYAQGQDATDSAPGAGGDRFAVAGNAGSGATGGDGASATEPGPPLTTHGPDFDIDWSAAPGAGDIPGGPGGGGGGGGIFGGGGGGAPGGAGIAWPDIDGVPGPSSSLYQAPFVATKSFFDPDTRYPGHYHFQFSWGGGGDGAGTPGIGALDTAADPFVELECWYIPLASAAPVVGRIRLS